MSYIMQTYKCLKCNDEINVALGTFGGGMPEHCECGGDYEYIKDGWHATGKTNLPK